MNRFEPLTPNNDSQSQGPVLVYGRHPVREALLSRKRVYERLYLLDSAQGEGIQEIKQEAKRLSLSLSIVSRKDLERLLGKDVLHQGVVLVCREKEVPRWKGVLERTRCLAGAVVVFVDQVEDTRNLGSIIRNASVFGAEAVIVSRARTAPMEADGVKATSGEIEKIDVLQINNFAAVLKAFRDTGFWIAALDGQGDRVLWDLHLRTGPLGVVIGGEDRGVRRRVMNLSDWIVRIPLSRGSHSLNASVALGIALYEIRRQQGIGE
ncbi:MAG TPA: RNA methyltransferase [Atribacteraceae bacterium]|nr:RNA methyltransferase [Atribacteraceae bacterium]